MSILPPIQRPFVAAPAPTDPTSFSVGFARTDITPRLGLGRIGYGPFQQPGLGVVGRLRATALVIDDGSEHRAALLATDLHGGSRWLTETLGARLASLRLPADRIFFGALHVHTSFGPFYGHMTYDRIVGTCHPRDWDQPFDLETAEWLARRLEVLLRDAVGDLRPGRVGYAAIPAWRAGWARGSPAMAWNPPGEWKAPRKEMPAQEPTPMTPAEILAWGQQLNPGAGLVNLDQVAPDQNEEVPLEPTMVELSAQKGPAYATADEAMEVVNRASWKPTIDLLKSGLLINSAVDRAKAHRQTIRTRVNGRKEARGDRALLDFRVHTLTAVNDLGDTLSLHFFGATSTVMGDQLLFYSADAYGYAAQWTERQLAEDGRRHYAHFVAGTLGDANVVSPLRGAFELGKASGSVDTAMEMVREAAAPLVAAALSAREAAKAASTNALRLRAAFAEANPNDNAGGGADLPLTQAMVAVPTLAASELAGLDWLKRLVLGVLTVNEGERLSFSVPDADPGYPKLPLPPLAHPPRAVPFRMLELTRMSGEPLFVLAGAPVEVGSILGLRIRDRLAAAIQARDGHAHPVPVVVASLMGDYAAYAGTESEYMAQHYEGGSTLWGRWTGEWCVRNLEALLTKGTAFSTATATFSSTTRPTRGYLSRADLPAADQPLRLHQWDTLANGRRTGAVRIVAPMGTGSAVAAMVVARPTGVFDLAEVEPVFTLGRGVGVEFQPLSDGRARMDERSFPFVIFCPGDGPADGRPWFFYARVAGVLPDDVVVRISLPGQGGPVDIPV